MTNLKHKVMFLCTTDDLQHKATKANVRKTPLTTETRTATKNPVFEP